MGDDTLQFYRNRAKSRHMENSLDFSIAKQIAIEQDADGAIPVNLSQDFAARYAFYQSGSTISWYCDRAAE